MKEELTEAVADVFDVEQSDEVSEDVAIAFGLEEEA